MKRAIFALVDCNNFFVSCERIFRPDLEGKPVVVLSSNDGCAVARSNEVKALGIPMGAPAFKYRDILRRNNVVQFSANFELYGDISRRITQILTSITPRTEIYSIDEVFLDLSELNITDYEAWGRAICDRIWREVGMPVSIGIAPTKTLAKLASELPKKDPAMRGTLNLNPPPQKPSEIIQNNNTNTSNFTLLQGATLQKYNSLVERYLQATPLEKVWGIGWRGAPKLRARGLATAWDIAHLRPTLAQQLMGIRGRQLVAELQGVSCFPLERMGRKAKSISRTRTFGEDTGELHVIESAIASFAVQAAYRLRHSGQLTKRAALFVTTNRHKPGYHSWTHEVNYDVPTADSGLLAETLVKALAEIYDPAQAYHRAGVWLYDFVPDDHLQTDILGSVDVDKHDKSQGRMYAVDLLNLRYGKNTVHFAAEDLAVSWQPKRQLRSPRYTSDWDDLPVVTPR
jgi:DNA polymerase V